MTSASILDIFNHHTYNYFVFAFWCHTYKPSKLSSIYIILTILNFSCSCFTSYLYSRSICLVACSCRIFYYLNEILSISSDVSFDTALSFHTLPLELLSMIKCGLIILPSFKNIVYIDVRCTGLTITSPCP